jgi:S-formylglutathione hydrolase FrmB
VRQPFGRALLAALALFIGPACAARAGLIDSVELGLLRRRISGQILDYTNNHGQNNRVYSQALCSCRDLYVYLPPCYDSTQKYPVVFFLHGFAQDERSFFYIVPEIDKAIRCGRMPAAIVVAVDGSISGDLGLLRARNSSFYINSKAGNFEEYLMNDVWTWVHENFPIRPEREAHVLAGASMGGGAAFDLGMRYRDRVATVAAIFPPVNLRYVDCHNNYRANFNPCCWGWRTELGSRHEPVGVFAFGLVKVRISAFIDPLYDWGPPAISGLSQHNPAEHLDRENIQNGDLNMYIAYGRCDQFNIDAQVKSFLAVASCRGVEVTTNYDPHGRHDLRTAMRFAPATIDWIGQKLQNYGPTRSAEKSQ